MLPLADMVDIPASTTESPCNPERIVLALKMQHTVPPGEADTDGHRFGFDGHSPRRLFSTGYSCCRKNQNYQ